jgi:hypothetical protein
MDTTNNKNKTIGIGNWEPRCPGLEYPNLSFLVWLLLISVSAPLKDRGCYKIRLLWPARGSLTKMDTCARLSSFHLYYIPHSQVLGSAKIYNNPFFLCGKRYRRKILFIDSIFLFEDQDSARCMYVRVLVLPNFVLQHYCRKKELKKNKAVIESEIIFLLKK